MAAGKEREKGRKARQEAEKVLFQRNEKGERLPMGNPDRARPYQLTGLINFPPTVDIDLSIIDYSSAERLFRLLNSTTDNQLYNHYQ